MSPNAQRVEIAAACGWTHDHINASAMFYDPSIDSHVGDPLNDLNAMHEAEKVLDAITQQCDYWDHLFLLTGGEFEMCHATAKHRVEAFLRTIGKWEEQP